MPLVLAIKGHLMVSLITCVIYIIFIFSLATRHCNDSGEWSEINCITSEEFEVILSLVESCHHNDAFKIIIFYILGTFFTWRCSCSFIRTKGNASHSKSSAVGYYSQE